MATKGEIRSKPLTTDAILSPDDRLARAWRARGFFGGLAAIGLALWGQYELIARGGLSTVGLLYSGAIVLLLLSMLQPRLGHPGRHGKSSDKETQAQTQETGIALPSTTTSLPVRKHSAPGSLTQPVPYPDAQVIQRSDGQVLKDAPSIVASGPHANAQAHQSRLRLDMWRGHLLWFGTSLTLLLAGTSAFVLQRSISDPLGGWLWAIALVMLLLTSVGTPLLTRAKSLLRSPADDFFAQGLPAIPRHWEALLIAGLLVLSLALRVMNLEYMPGIFGDEGERGMDARAINEGKPALLFGYGWWGVPNLYFYLVSFMLRIFGDNMVGVRMLSVISGVAAVWFVYRTGRLLWGPRAGLIAGSMLAISPLALQFSRLAGESTPTGTLWIAGAYYFLMALRYLRWRDWALAGVLWGFSLYFYAAGKLIIPIIAMLGLYCVVRWRGRFFKHYAAGFALLLFGFGLTFMPYGIFSSQEKPPWQGFSGRAQETSIFSPGNQARAFSAYGIPYDSAQVANPLLQNLLAQPLAWGQLLLRQIQATTDVLYKRGDPTQFYQISEHNGSMLAPAWAAIALLGLVFGAWKFWDERYGLLTIIFWGGMLGAALTLDTPSVQRLAGAWPLLMLFPAALLDRVFAAAWPLDMRLARRWAAVPIAGLLIFLATDSYREYFVHYASRCPYCGPTTQARFVQALGQDYKVYQMGVGAGGSPEFFSYGSTRFVAKGVEGTDLAAPADFFPLTDSRDKGAAFLIYPNNYAYKPLVRLFYPGGEEAVVRSNDSVERFTSYKVTREQISQLQTSRATYSPARAAAISRDEPNIGTLPLGGLAWSPPAGVTYPLTATWQGGVVAPAYESYTFEIEGAQDARLEIDGRNFPLRANEGRTNGGGPRLVEVVLAKGIHEIRLSGILAGPQSRLSLRWSGTKAASQVAIASTYLYNSTGREALMGGLGAEVGPLSSPELLTEADPFGGLRPEARRSDPFIGFREATVAFGKAPFLVRWQGSINITTPGDYLFRLNSQGPSVMWVDGRIIGNPDVSQNTGASAAGVSLTVGGHQVEIRYAWGGGPAIIEWYWSTPDGRNGLVPTGALTPAARSWLPSEMADAPGAPGPMGEPATLEAVYGAEAGLANPQGIGVDTDGNFYVGDKGNGRIVAFSPDGRVLRTWGKAGNGQSLQPGEFLDMQDVAVSEDGLIAVTDFRARRVQLFDKQGGLKALFDTSITEVEGPNGNAWSRGRSIYLADTAFSKLRKLTLAPNNSLQSVVTVPIGEQNKLEQCLDVAVDSRGSVYVVDVKDRILRISPDGSTTIYRLPVGKNSGGSRLAISPDGSRLYMSDPDRKRVAILNTVTGSLNYFGEAGSKPGQFGEPSGIAAGADGRIYVLDRLNNNIQVFNPPR